MLDVEDHKGTTLCLHVVDLLEQTERLTRDVRSIRQWGEPTDRLDNEAHNASSLLTEAMTVKAEADEALEAWKIERDMFPDYEERDRDLDPSGEAAKLLVALSASEIRLTRQALRYLKTMVRMISELALPSLEGTSWTKTM